MITFSWLIFLGGCINIAYSLYKLAELGAKAPTVDEIVREQGISKALEGIEAHRQSLMLWGSLLRGVAFIVGSYAIVMYMHGGRYMPTTLVATALFFAGCLLIWRNLPRKY